MLQMRNSVHHDFERHRYLLFYFFGGTARPLRDYLHIVISNIRVGFYRQIVKGNNAPNKQKNRDRQYQKTIVQRAIDNLANHYYCSTVFCRTRAFETTCWPGRKPDAISCILPGSIAPPVTSTRRNCPSSAGT